MSKLYAQEEINEMLKELKSTKAELEVYKKAYDLLSKAYCDKGDCWTKCECYGQCLSNMRDGEDITKEFFLKKAREEE